MTPIATAARPIRIDAHPGMPLNGEDWPVGGTAGVGVGDVPVLAVGGVGVGFGTGDAEGTLLGGEGVSVELWPVPGADGVADDSAATSDEKVNEPEIGSPSTAVVRQLTVYLPAGAPGCRGWVTVSSASFGGPCWTSPFGPVTEMRVSIAFTGSEKVSVTAAGVLASSAPSAGLVFSRSVWAEAGAVPNARARSVVRTTAISLGRMEHDTICPD